MDGTGRRKKGHSVDVKDLLEELQKTIENARSMPMSASAVINRGEVLELIARIEEAFPAAFEQSDKVFAERDAMMAEAEARAAESSRRPASSTTAWCPRPTSSGSPSARPTSA